VKWDDKSKNIALKEIIRDMAEKPVTQEKLEKLHNYSGSHEELTNNFKLLLVKST